MEQYDGNCSVVVLISFRVLEFNNFVWSVNRIFLSIILFSQ